MKSPLNIKEKAYENQNRKMRKDYTKETGKTLGSRQTSGTGKRKRTRTDTRTGLRDHFRDVESQTGNEKRRVGKLPRSGFVHQPPITG